MNNKYIFKHLKNKSKSVKLKEHLLLFAVLLVGSVFFTSNSALASNLLDGIKKHRVDCATYYTTPFIESFKEESSTRDCWKIVDINDDGDSGGNGTWHFVGDRVEYKKSVQDRPGNDWLISPKIKIKDKTTLKFDYVTFSIGDAPKLSIWVILGDQDEYKDSTKAKRIVDNLGINTFEKITIPAIDLSKYAGKNVHIGLKSEVDLETINMIIRNFVVETAIEQFSITAKSNIEGEIYPNKINIVDKGENLNFKITPAANYSIDKVMVDGTDRKEDLVNNVYSFVNVQENHTINVSYTKNSDIICTTQTLPFTENFDSESPSRTCWTTIDIDGDGVADEGYGMWIFTDGDAECTFTSDWQNTPLNDWLISPKLSITSGVSVQFDYKTDNIPFEEIFSVYVITGTPDNYADAVQILEQKTITNHNFETIDAITIPEQFNNQEVYIGIKCESEAVKGGILYIDNFVVKSSTQTLAKVSASVDGGNGMISPTLKNVLLGENIEFSISPNFGYQLESLTHNGDVKTEDVIDNKYSISDIQADVEIVVKFKKSIYSITASVDGANGTINAETETANLGENKKITISPAEGYELESLLDNETEKFADVVENVYKLTNIQENHNISVKFKEKTMPVADPNLELNPTALDFVAAGDEKTVAVTSNIKWTATSSETWLTVIEGSGTNNGEFTLKAEANTTGTERTAVVTVKQDGGTLEQTVSVKQAAQPASHNLTLDVTEVILSPTGEEKPVKVTSNVNWTVSTIDGEWLTIDPKSGSNNASIMIKAEANTTGAERTAVVTVKQDDGDLAKTVTVTQAAAEVVTPNLELNPTALDFLAAGDEKTIVVTSNINWTATSSETWLTVIDESGSNGGEFKLKAEANTTGAERTAVVTVKQNDGDLAKTVTVTQAAQPTITHKITASVIGGNGTISPYGEQTVKNKESISFTITPGNGYLIDEIRVDDQPISSELADNVYTFTNVETDHTISVKFKSSTSISTIEMLQVNLFPNPTNDVLNIEASEEISQIEIITIDGRTIDKQNVNNNRYQYQTSALVEGIYFAKIQTNNKTIIKQFVVRK